MKAIARLIPAVMAAMVLSAQGFAEAVPCEPQRIVAEPSPEAAISLKRLAAKLGNCRNFGWCDEKLTTLFGLTRISGYVVDATQHDILIFGVAKKGDPRLHLEDFVVAFKNANHQYVKHEGDKLYIANPGVSIDPNPAVWNALDSVMAARGTPIDAVDAQWCSTCRQPQSVRVEGIPFDTHFADVMLKADYLMKRFADGSAGLSWLQGVSDMHFQEAVEQAKRGGGDPMQMSMNRFWFYPGVNIVEKSPTAVRIVRSDVTLLDEAQYQTRDGRLLASAKRDPLASRFACEFTKRYPDVATMRQYRIYTELEGLFRWVALARQLTANKAFELAGMPTEPYLDQGLVRKTTVAHQVNGIANVKKFAGEVVRGERRIKVVVHLPSCGGVSIDLKPEKTTTKWNPPELAVIVKAVLASRPGSEAVAWRIR